MTITTSKLFDDKELRKAWLKRKFTSFEYHEDMLKVHARFLAVVKAALTRAENDLHAVKPPAWLRGSAVPNFEKVAKPGTIDPKQFKPGQVFGAALYILDYDHDSGLDVPSTWNWMTEAERGEMYPLWEKMSRMAMNIRYTVDSMWEYKGTDDYILDEKNYTGPIDWPVNWKEDLLGTQGAGLLNSGDLLRAKAGEPAPRAGLWQAIDISSRQVKVKAGDNLPDLSSAYGLTLWQWMND